jgi:hypothetical protein
MFEVRMFRSSIALAGALSLLAATHAAAQSTPAGVPPANGRITVSLNGGFQIGKQDFTRSANFTLYDEEAQIEIAQTDIEGGGLFDIGARYHWRDQWGAGASYTFLRSTGNGSVTGSIPHPLVFDQFRSVTHSESDLEHKESGFHLYATYHIPYTDKVDFTVMAGPSFYNISQDFIRGITISETPPFTEVTIDEVQKVSLKQNAVGINFGVDGTYEITRMIGAGVLARYTWAGAEFELGEGNTAKVNAGGFQLAGGVRVRF